MLTADLAISWRRGDKIFPRFIKTTDANYLRDAENLIAIFEDFIDKTRAELDAELEEYVGTGTDYKILRGLIKLLQDRSEFETSSVAEPAEIRRAVFLAAKESHPLLPDSEKRKEVLGGVADSLGTDPASLFACLYADLPAQQRLKEFKTTSPHDLLERYNLAQAQAVLYRAAEMKIWLAPAGNAKNYRDVFQSIKYFRLIHSVVGNPTNGYEITLAGAASVFHRSQKYGIQMSVFLPALLNCRNWRMRAEIDLKSGERAFFELDSETDLRSCYEEEPEYENPVHEKLVRDWGKHESEWRLEANREVVNLGRTAFIPDFVLKKDKAKVYLEILGFWTPASLRKRLEELQSANNFILAAWEELRGSRDEPVGVPENVILFKSKLEPRVLEIAAEKQL
ncbi:MAG TPA: DUF790 family protein [Pyrinomonadaceae bacterium]|nr:DUF790 family protein [Pyrinomonadaceae bacterium]